MFRKNAIIIYFNVYKKNSESQFSRFFSFSLLQYMNKIRFNFQKLLSLD